MSSETKTKPGIKTTEFWITAALSVAALLVQAGVITTDQEAVIAVTIPQVVALAFYIVSRVKAKA